MTRAISGALALLLAAAPAAAQDEKLPASKHHWMKWKTGTTTQYKLNLEFGGQKQELEITYKLTEVAAGSYTIMVVTKGGADEERTEKQDVPVKSGQEKITVAGKELACTVWKSKGTRNDVAGEQTFWIAEGTSMPVKMAAKTEGQEEYEVTATSLKEEVTVGGKKYECVRLAGKMILGGGEMEIVFWMSDKIPGGPAKVELKGGDGALSGTMELTEAKEGK